MLWWCDVVCCSVSPVSSQDRIPPDQPGSGWGSKVGKDGEIRERKGLNGHRRRLEAERARFDIKSCCLSAIRKIQPCPSVTSEPSLLGKCQVLTFIPRGKVVGKM